MRGDDTEYVSIEDVVVKRVTPKAIMISCDDADVDEQWVPLSVVDWEASSAEPSVGSEGTLYLAEWFARKESLV